MDLGKTSRILFADNGLTRNTMDGTEDNGKFLVSKKPRFYRVEISSKINITVAAD